MEFKTIPSGLVHKVWVDIEHLLQKVIDKMDCPETTDDLLAGLLSQERQLWVVYDDNKIVAAVLTYMETSFDRRVGYITHAGGTDYKEWHMVTEPIADWFKYMGCVRFEIQGRKGWGKCLDKFKSVRTVYERVL